jgi:hypothetical protein
MKTTMTFTQTRTYARAGTVPIDTVHGVGRRAQSATGETDVLTCKAVGAAACRVQMQATKATETSSAQVSNSARRGSVEQHHNSRLG